MPKEKLEISYGEIVDRFNSHLRQKHNTNILFSGKFGSGKSTFLRHFFRKYPSFYPITLRPVNYVVSSNEDIFQLIKVDIIKQLFDDGHLDLENEELKNSIFSKGWKFFKKRPLEVTRHLAYILSKLHPFFEVANVGAEGIYRLIQSFEEFEKGLEKETKADYQQVDEYRINQHLSSGTYIEFDMISSILRRCITNSSKKPILIIDDLDRLDPDHIFRILNIFSAHDNHVYGDHKFGFKKVIIVADIDNLEKLFRHRYGSDADFEGYIEKFYSDQVFNFSNDDALVSFLSNDLRLDLSDQSLTVLRLMLTVLLEKNLIRIRNIIKYRNFRKPRNFDVAHLDADHEGFKRTSHLIFIKSRSIYTDSDDIDIIYVVAFLCTLFGRISTLKEALIGLETHNLTIDKAIVPDVVRSFALVKRYVSNRDDLLKFYFTINKDRNPLNPRPEFGPIQGVFHEVKFEIITKWRLVEYTGDESFFADYRLNILPDAKASIGFSKVVESLLSIVRYIETDGRIQSSLGISC